MGQRKNYDREFKLEVVKLVTEAGRTVSSVANDLGIAKSTVTKWVKENEALLKGIKRVYKKSRGLYGSIRVTKKLNNEGIKCSRNRVYKLMKKNNISSVMNALKNAVGRRRPPGG